ncbi:MAG: hypothetical protein HY436_01325, partial [Candidatus Liptonbacteria bacterium]|nr:hypothetical protein [Candidatus Liptonbacteria bacterium]
ITVNKNLRYTNVNGDDVIGLLAQKNVHIGLVSENNLRIDAALVAKSGRFGRFHYRPEGSQGQGGCQPYHTRELLETFGMVATNKDLQVNYEDNTGYLTWIFRYDANLLYRPPPFFPLVGPGYEQISWDEVK